MPVKGCGCLCHRGLAKHIAPCCIECPKCGEFVRYGFFEAHKCTSKELLSYSPMLPSLWFLLQDGPLKDKLKAEHERNVAAEANRKRNTGEPEVASDRAATGGESSR